MRLLAALALLVAGTVSTILDAGLVAGLIHTFLPGSSP
jgi:hypothetical protein